MLSETIGGESVCMNKIIKAVTAALSAVSVALFSICGAVSYSTPSEITIISDETAQEVYNFPLSLKYDDCSAVSASADGASEDGSNTSAEIMLFNTIPVKEVTVNFSERKYVIPCGTPFGIKIYSNGLVVVQTSEVETKNGKVNPSQEAGIQCGDIITSVNGIELTENEQLSELVENSGGESLTITAVRDEKTYTTQITPVLDNSENVYRIGLYIKDSCAGIGTLTFIDSESGSFAGLGHGICDSESGQLIPLLSGDIVNASISSIRKSCSGSPGSLCGYFSDDASIGTIISNSEYGVYGSITSYDSESKAIPVAFKQEIQTGYAQILTTIDGTEAKYYDIEIESISYNSDETKNMVIKITDEELLEQTGGIVQGMSGSPIIQNGMLVGAVTHVFVNDTKCGYAVFAENMINYSKIIVQNNTDLAS